MSVSAKEIFNKFEDVVSSLCLAGMTVLIAVQVFNRYVLQSSLDWSEELARYLFIWSVYVGCSFATQKDRHLEVTILRFAFGGRLAKPVTLLANICSMVFCACITVWGTQMVQFLIGTGQKTPALEVPMYWIYLCLPLGMGLMTLRTGERIWGILTGAIDPSNMEIK